MLFKSWRSKRHRERQRLKDNQVQITLNMKHRLVQMELNKAFENMRITSTHEQLMLELHRQMPRGNKVTHGGLILELREKLDRIKRRGVPFA